MKAESRKAPRRLLRYPAWIEERESAERECQIADVSKGGARLVVTSPDDVPQDFTLRLSQQAASRRKSRVVWRSDTEIGVEFLKDSKSR